ncbi:esterase-like activity of phytase family protein [Dactylosporangium roseum]|uniref:esterase-like activity of phytase family protein n=1 Tax=Dactylosporangium roseum TaxID=47989 RepID=UPI0021B339D6|nr:esterase-like activity of phytase family protein [Dactylosporangium roseum]
MKTKLSASAAAVALVIATAGPAYGGDEPAPGEAQLHQFAKLPAQTFVPGSEPSGSRLGTAPINGITPPFANQPVQGFSGVLRNADGSFEMLSDNGYGNKANSADFILRIQRVKPNFHTGAVDVVGGINLTDPNNHVPFPLTRPDRVLSGFDFDPESIVRLPDGTYWIGDEFGPFLLHFDCAGRLLSPPVSLPGVFSPENPFRGTTPANLGGSKGFESIAISPDRRTLYPLLEGVVAGDPAGSLRLNEFSVQSGAYTGRTWRYQLENPAYAVADAVMVNQRQILVIERDNNQGDAALFKKIYLADLRDRDGNGAMDKTEVADLLNLANPRGVGGFGDPFRFPFFTIESLLILDNRTLLIANDNNFPLSAGRTPGKPDDNEMIAVRLGTTLDVDHRVLH